MSCGGGNHSVIMLKQSALSCPSVFPDLSVYQSCPSVCPVHLSCQSVQLSVLSICLPCPAICPVHLPCPPICPVCIRPVNISAFCLSCPVQLSVLPVCPTICSICPVQLSVCHVHLSVLLSVLPACYHVHLSVLLSTLPVCLVHLSVPSCPSICPVVCVRSLSNRNLQNHCPFL